jgi:hypothetical protein
MVKDCKIKIVNERKVKRREAQGDVVSHKQQIVIFIVYLTTIIKQQKNIWYIDFGATQHMKSAMKVHQISLYY